MSEENKEKAPAGSESPDKAEIIHPASDNSANGDSAAKRETEDSGIDDAPASEPEFTIAPPRSSGNPEAVEAPPAESPAGSAGQPPADPEREAKLKAAAEARAARAAAKAAAEGKQGGQAAAPAASDGGQPAADQEKAAKVKAAAEARAARAAAKAAAEAEEAAAGPKPPSVNQPRLDEAAQLIRSLVHADAVDEAYINELNGDMPTLVVRGEHWFQTAGLLRDHAMLRCDYLRNVSGVDYETHMEVVYHVISLTSKHDYAIKIKTDREAPVVPSATPVWATANWNEREIFDLLGIDFPGHPDLRRIMMPDDWVGYPLRKDYEPLDPEV